jgi:phospholipase/lecithinase/hemolysin
MPLFILVAHHTSLIRIFQESAHANGLTSHLFINVPPEERAPARNGNAAAQATEAQRVTEYNTALAQHVAQFAKAHPEATVLSFDAHMFFNTVLDNPVKYGFKNTTGYCTCTDDSYFWYST